MNYKIITLTGGDRTGKETQSRLLTWVLDPSRRMDSPDYTHWSGQLIRAILNEETFSLARRRSPSFPEVPAGSWFQEKHPEIFQLLQTINLTARQRAIQEGLQHHHWIMDRYDVDAQAFGIADGCQMSFLLNLQSHLKLSDLALVMVGTPFPRPGETPDLNERDQGFQDRVRALYQALALQDRRFQIVAVDRHSSPLPAIGIWRVHTELVERLNAYFGFGLRAWGVSEIERWLAAGKPEAPAPRAVAPPDAAPVQLGLPLEFACEGC